MTHMPPSQQAVGLLVLSCRGSIDLLFFKVSIYTSMYFFKFYDSLSSHELLSKSRLFLKERICYSREFASPPPEEHILPFIVDTYRKGNQNESDRVFIQEGYSSRKAVHFLVFSGLSFTTF